MLTPTTRREPRSRVGAVPLSVGDLLGRLEAVRPNGEGRWMARCPAHGDRTASLSVREGDDGRILLHDFGGCEFSEILAALGIEARQLFRPSAEPWPRRPPRPDPDREARAYFDRLCRLRAPPPPDRMRSELEFVGRLILGGTRAFAELPEGFRSEILRTWPLRLAFEAMAEVARQGTPRHWFSPLALAREFDRAGGLGCAERHQVFLWSRMAVRAVVREAKEREREREGAAR